MCYTVSGEGAHTRARTHTRTRAHAHAHAHAHTHTHTHTHERAHTHTRARTCTHTHTHAHTRTHCFSFSFSSRWHGSARKGPYALHPVSQQSPQGCPRNSANIICLVEHRSFSSLEGGMSAASFLHSSFLQAVNDVMLWLVRVEKVPQTSEHLCPAKLQTRCDICCACQSTCPFILTDSGVPRTVDPQKSL